jgi:hypothetical protein
MNCMNARDKTIISRFSRRILLGGLSLQTVQTFPLKKPVFGKGLQKPFGVDLDVFGIYGSEDVKQQMVRRALIELEVLQG